MHDDLSRVNTEQYKPNFRPIIAGPPSQKQSFRGETVLLNNQMDDGNVYLNGAKNMADAIRQSANQSERNGMAGMHSTTASIAQRMKQNRD